MRVWIDQEQCTGSGLCELIEPRVFLIGEEGLACVQQDGHVRPAGPAGRAAVPPDCEDTVLEARQGCPGGCIQVDEDDDAP
jgi:ferredoxin